MTFNRKLQLLVATAVLVMALFSAYQGISEYRKFQSDTLSQTLSLSERSASDLLTSWVRDRSVLLEALAQQASEVVPMVEQMALVKTAGFDLVFVGYGDNDRLVWSKPEPAPKIRVREQGWYQMAHQADRTVLTDPYRDSVTGQMVVTLSTPMPGNRPGVASGDLSLGTLSDELITLLPESQGELMLVDRELRVIASRAQGAMMRPLAERLGDSQLVSALARGERVESSLDGKPVLLAMTQVAGLDWQVVVALDLSQPRAALQGMFYRIVLVTLLCVVAAVVVASLVLKRLLQPLAELESAMDDLTHGDGDLTRRLQVVRQDEFGRVSGKLNTFMAQLAQMIVQVRQVAGSMDAQSQSNRGVVAEQAQAIDGQQGKVDQVATAVEEMAMTAHEVASHAANTAEAAQQASHNCGSGQVVLDESNANIQGLAEQVRDAAVIITQLDGNAQEINKILATIQTIAEQTNLLALNAAIEAARAGDQGRGFAVVADEVRVLSQKTQGSAEEIQQMIETLQANTHRAVEAMNQGRQMAEISVGKTSEVTQSLASITSAIDQIMSMSEQIAAAAEEQRAATSEVSESTAGIREDALALSGQSESVAATAASISTTADELTQLLAKFKA